MPGSGQEPNSLSPSVLYCFLGEFSQIGLFYSTQAFIIQLKYTVYLGAALRAGGFKRCFPPFIFTSDYKLLMPITTMRGKQSCRRVTHRHLPVQCTQNKPNVLFCIIKLMEKLMYPHNNEPLWLIRGSACKVQSVQT